MTRRAWTSVFTAAAMAVALPVYAQDDKGSQGQRPNSTGSSSGTATSRPAGGSGGSSGGSSGGAVSRPSGGESSSSGDSRPSGVSRPSGSGGGYEGYRAPARPERRTGTAVPRGGGDTQRAAAPSGAAAASAGDNSDRRRAVPAYSRPRDGRPTVGTAVARTRPPYASGIYGGYYDPFNRWSYYSNRYPYGYFWPGYGFGVGYFYDPWMWGYASPYGYGGYYDPYGGYGGTYSRREYRDTGSLRLKVKPAHGQVYVDGYYVGEVDSFDGVFQRLTLDAGAHRIEIRAEGYETSQFEVLVIQGETVTYKGDMMRIQ
jgi:hypothetical protein